MSETLIILASRGKSLGPLGYKCIALKIVLQEDGKNVLLGGLKHLRSTHTFPSTNGRINLLSAVYVKSKSKEQEQQKQHCVHRFSWIKGKKDHLPASRRGNLGDVEGYHSNSGRRQENKGLKWPLTPLAKPKLTELGVLKPILHKSQSKSNLSRK